MSYAQNKFLEQTFINATQTAHETFQDDPITHPFEGTFITADLRTDAHTSVSDEIDTLKTKTQNQTATANVTTFDNAISTTFINDQGTGDLRIGFGADGLGFHTTCVTHDLLPNVGDTRNIGSTPVRHYNAGYINNIFTTSINAGGGLISNVSDPAADQDAATKKYVVDTLAPLETKTQNITADATKTTIDQTLNLTAFAKYQGFNYSSPPGVNTLAPVDYVNTVGNTKLALSGGTMTGVIDMGANKITGLDDPTLPQDAATKTYVDSAKTFIDLTPTTAPTAVEGRIYYDSADDVLKFYNGLNWLRIISEYDIIPLLTSASQNGFVVTESSFWPNFDGYKSFNKIPAEGSSSGGSTGWGPADGTFISGVAQNVRTKFDRTNVAMEWLQIEMPQIKTITKIKLKDRSDVTGYSPVDFRFHASLDNITWNTILTVTGHSQSAAYEETEWAVNTMAKYIGVSCTASAGGDSVTFNELFIYGY